MGLAKGQKLLNKSERKRISVELYNLKLCGASTAEIAIARQMPERTVRSYLKAFERVSDREFKDITAKYVAKQIFLRSARRCRYLWNLYNGRKKKNKKGEEVLVEPTDNIRLGVMMALREEDSHVVKMAQSLGYVHQAPQRIEGQITFADLMILAGQENGTDDPNGNTGNDPKPGSSVRPEIKESL